MNLATANKIIDTAMRDGGGTFSPTGESVSPDRGYAVGLYPETWVKTHFVTIAAEIVRDAAVIFPNAYIGIWMTEGGKFHIDPVAIIEDYDEAVEVGRKNSQIGIYNFATGKTVLL